jgi:hypothetical protein
MQRLLSAFLALRMNEVPGFEKALVDASAHRNRLDAGSKK